MVEPDEKNGLEVDVELVEPVVPPLEKIGVEVEPGETVEFVAEPVVEVVPVFSSELL